MSNLRERAREVKAQGERDRGSFEPTGAPLRFWKYWRDNSMGRDAREFRHTSKRENFCHFWRVVAIWAPLLFLKTKAVAFVNHPATIVGLAIAFVIAVISLVTLGGGWTEVGIAALIILAAAAGVAVAVGLGLLINKYVGPHWNTDWNFKIGVGVAALVVLGVWTASVIAAMSGDWLGVITFMVVPAVLALVVFVAYHIVQWVRAWSKVKEAERIANPKPSPQYAAPREPREPGRISKFFTSIADFLVFAGQVVRVNKWKICPIVDVNADKQN